MDQLNDEATFRSIVDATRAEPNGEVASIERRIAAFEAEYQMDSAEMSERVERGDLKSTRSVEAWLMALRVRDEFASAKARSR